MRARLVALFTVLGLVVGVTPAFAQAQVEVFLTVKAPEQNAKDKDSAPQIEATVVGGPTVPVDKFTLVEPGAKVPYVIKATNLRPFTAGTETIAVAFVFNGQEVWIGNDDYEPEESPARYLGILKNLKTALQTVPFATAGPAGSKGVLISYGDKAEVKIPMGPLANINAEALGSQKDYHKKFGTAMVEGIRLALAELHNVTASRKALVVVCDGSDTNPDAAKAQLADLKKQAAQDKIQTFAIIFKGQLPDAGNVIGTMIPNATTVDNAEGIATAVKAILSRMADRYYLTFPGYDPKTKQGPLWDGKSHDLVIKIDKDETDPVTLTLSPVWNAPKKGGFPWWILVIAIVGLLLLIIIIAKVFGGKKEAPAPMPMPMAMAPMEAPKPAGPMKTVMIGVGGDQDGFPVVGWLVPLNGQDAYKTFRCRSGGTKIGTAPPSDIVVNDGFMSTEHCQINASPAGFTLVDGGSTNGCYVNDRKVAKHDLVDNDVITLGKT
ncbi:MAG: FHA domain-containing protein, partial [Deltaproteobacteria bacterium]|nr:FHA domain-containing protein [Deltaproteobacteria bacterium]